MFFSSFSYEGLIGSNGAGGVTGIFEQLPLPRWLTFNQAAT